METMLGYLWIVLIVLIIFCYKLVLRFFGIIIIPNDAIGIVNKRFVIFGSHRTLPDGAIIALNGEAGYQADTLAPGLHFWLWPWDTTFRSKNSGRLKKDISASSKQKTGVR